MAKNVFMLVTLVFVAHCDLSLAQSQSGCEKLRSDIFGTVMQACGIKNWPDEVTSSDPGDFKEEVCGMEKQPTCYETMTYMSNHAVDVANKFASECGEANLGEPWMVKFYFQKLNFMCNGRLIDTQNPNCDDFASVVGFMMEACPMEEKEGGAVELSRDTCKTDHCDRYMANFDDGDAMRKLIIAAHQCHQDIGDEENKQRDWIKGVIMISQTDFDPESSVLGIIKEYVETCVESGTQQRVMQAMTKMSSLETCAQAKMLYDHSHCCHDKDARSVAAKISEAMARAMGARAMGRRLAGHGEYVMIPCKMMKRFYKTNNCCHENGNTMLKNFEDLSR